MMSSSFGCIHDNHELQSCADTTKLNSNLPQQSYRGLGYKRNVHLWGINYYYALGLWPGVGLPLASAHLHSHYTSNESQQASSPYGTTLNTTARGLANRRAEKRHYRHCSYQAPARSVILAKSARKLKAQTKWL